MNRKILIICLSVCANIVLAQNDTTLVERNVTVEREFTPIIQSAYKIVTKPMIYTPTITKKSVSYTDFNKPLDTDFNLSSLSYAEVNFMQPKTDNGFLRGGVGVWNTVADFSYNMSDRNKVSLDVKLKHIGLWGNKRLADTNFALDLNKQFTNLELFAGVDVDNSLFNYYGRYFNDSIAKKYDFSTLKTDSAVNGRFWNVKTKIGIQSAPKAELTYLIKTGYESFNAHANFTEHQVNSMFHLGWTNGNHALGGNASLKNLFYKNTLDTTVIKSHHILKLLPYYSYSNNVAQVKAGINLDFSFGKAAMFRPSPNVNFEVKITPEWLALYGGVVGEYKVETMQQSFAENRYLVLQQHVNDSLFAYTPIDAFWGLKIRPQANLLINLFVDYAYTINQHFYLFNTSGAGNFTRFYANTQCFKVGATVLYHFQDIVNISVNGAYNNWQVDGQQYAWDRPNWEANALIQVKITDQISVYTDNYFMGKRYAKLDNGTVASLKPTLDLNIGGMYTFNKWFSAFVKLNNIANNKHEQFYAYQVQGINFLLGATYAF